MLKSAHVCTLLSIAIFVWTSAVSAQPCPLIVLQRSMGAYVEDARFTSMWEVQLTAEESLITAVRLSLTPPAPYNPIVRVKDMEEAGQASSLSSSPSSSSVRFYRLPLSRTSRGGILPHQTHSFTYVVRGMAPASISLVAVSCVADRTHKHNEAVSSSALPFYVGPLSSFFGGKGSSARSSALGNKPKVEKHACSVQIDQLARSLEKGGSWFDTEYMYRTYDLNITNVGTKAFAWSHVEVELQPEEELYEWWNMVRPSATEPVLKVNTNGGLDAGKKMTAGYVLRSPLSVRVRDDPALKLSKVSCVGSEPQEALPPVFCRAGLNITSRHESDGGRWTDGEFVYQVHDIKILNQGGRLVKDARLSINVDPRAVLTQWWEVNRMGTSTVFHLGNPILVDTMLPAGVIERMHISVASSPYRVPFTALLDSVTCV